MFLIYYIDHIEKIKFKYGIHNVELFIVEDWKKFPEPCREPKIVGCALYGTEKGLSYIVINAEHLDYVDQWGYSVLWHEMNHVFCQCNWHSDFW